MVPRDGAVQNGYLTGLRSALWLVSVDNRVVKQITGAHPCPVGQSAEAREGLLA